MGSTLSNFHDFIMSNNDEQKHNDEQEEYQSDYEREARENIKKYKILLLSSWKELNKNKEDVGLSIYNSIVFGNTSKGAQGRTRPTMMYFQNTDLQQQSLRFMEMLNTVITKLNDPNPKMLIKKLNQLSQSHSNAYHVKKQNYMDFQKGFMKAIKRYLSNIWTIQHNEAWVWFWNFIISIMSPCSDDDIDIDDINDIDNDNNNHNDIITHNEKINDKDIIDINEYFIKLNNNISNCLKYLNIPQDIIQIITIFSLNLTSFHKSNKNKDIELIEIEDECKATRISNKHYSWCCASVMSKYWISNKSPLNNYIHRITIIIEENNMNRNNNNIEACIGFTSKCIKHHLQGSNGFGDLECGFAVRCWDKYLINHGKKISSDTLKDPKHNDILEQRLHPSMEIDDELTFIIDMNENNKDSTIEILLNNKRQDKKLRFTNVPNKIALCASIWPIGLIIRIKSWLLITKNTE